MKLGIIVAMGKNQVIGKDNAMPWHLSADLRYFKQTTLGKPIIMGRKTYESIGRILPGRQNIVVTRNPDYKIDAKVPEQSSLSIVNSLDEALASVKAPAPEVMVIGGSTLYKQALGKADSLYLTYIHEQFEGDTFFPDIDMESWSEVWREDHAADEKNPHAYSFVRLEKKY